MEPIIKLHIPKEKGKILLKPDTITVKGLPPNIDLLEKAIDIPKIKFPRRNKIYF